MPQCTINIPDKLNRKLNILMICSDYDRKDELIVYLLDKYLEDYDRRVKEMTSN